MAQQVYRPDAVRELDRIAIEEQGIPGYELMKRAGRATYIAAAELYPHASRWLVLCGSGNNAGDGYVIARLARENGKEVRVIALSPPANLTGAAATARDDFAAIGGSVAQWRSPADLDAADIVIDAMLGTGLIRPVAGIYLEVVEALAQRPPSTTVVAVDIATGLSGLTGEVMGAAVRADLTVTYVGLKLGLFLGNGPDYSGELRFADLGIQAVDSERVQPVLRVFTAERFRELMPRRKRMGHKGNYGHVLIIGGNTGMAGAARLAGEAALRSGAGLVSVATRAANTAAIVAGRPELMCHGIETDNDLDALLARASVIALGPGLGQDEWARHVYKSALAAGKPLVLDADALNLLAESPQQRDDWIMTPHPGEAGRLLGSTTAQVQADRLACLGSLTSTYGGCAVLKGHATLVADNEPAALPWLIRAGNPGMATAGMGDVLTGITAAIYAQCAGAVSATGCSIADIAAAAAWLHATAGDRAAAAGERGLVASDLFAELRACLNN
jgi:NAD(P)H-hydrate epimerase